MALFESRRIIEISRMDAKASLDLLEIVKCASLNLARLPCLLGLFAFILADFNRPRAECALCTRYLRAQILAIGSA